MGPASWRMPRCSSTTSQKMGGLSLLGRLSMRAIATVPSVHGSEDDTLTPLTVRLLRTGSSIAVRGVSCEETGLERFAARGAAAEDGTVSTTGGMRARLRSM
mmetsp:Transcript_27491/g.69990  ORF Transcript_27491/g.69990 Transcript_27491/m.69990 type:complete len:102 (-) Transcript_27491:240-545(-)